MKRSSELEKTRTANEQLKRTLTEDTGLESSHARLERSRLVPSVLYSRTGLGRCTPRRFWAWTLDLETETPGQPLIQTETPGWFRVQLSEYYNFGQIDLLDTTLFWV